LIGSLILIPNVYRFVKIPYEREGNNPYVRILEKYGIISSTIASDVTKTERITQIIENIEGYQQSSSNRARYHS
jgi:hypothetical protein